MDISNFIPHLIKEALLINIEFGDYFAIEWKKRPREGYVIYSRNYSSGAYEYAAKCRLYGHQIKINTTSTYDIYTSIDLHDPNSLQKINNLIRQKVSTMQINRQNEHSNNWSKDKSVCIRES